MSEDPLIFPAPDDPREAIAMEAIADALDPLDPDQRQRALEYLLPEIGACYCDPDAADRCRWDDDRHQWIGPCTPEHRDP